MKAPNEKLIELLFTRYMLQSFRLTEVSLYAPSSREEFRKGYDAKFIGKKSCKELYLQFKTPNLTRSGFTIRITPHQHNRLTKYPHGSAYYISHTFQDISEVQDAQLKVSLSSDFLKQYIAITASSLPYNTNFVQYKREPISEYPREPKYKTDQDGNIRKARTNVMKSEWLRGDVLLQRFKDDQIGSRVRLRSFDDNQDHPVYIAGVHREGVVRESIFDFTEDEEGNLGMMLRIYDPTTS